MLQRDSKKSVVHKYLVSLQAKVFRLDFVKYMYITKPLTIRDKPDPTVATM
jgi:hypothetical protein